MAAAYLMSNLDARYDQTSFNKTVNKEWNNHLVVDFDTVPAYTYL